MRLDNIVLVSAFEINDKLNVGVKPPLTRVWLFEISHARRGKTAVYYMIFVKKSCDIFLFILFKFLI